MKKYFLLIAVILGLVVPNANAQCKVNNTFFQAGEQLHFDLYIKYGLINAKAGSTSLNVVSERYDGKDALKMRLIAKTTGTIHSFYPLSDTLTSYMTKDLVPLRYIKRAHEEGNDMYEDLYYSYAASGNTIRTSREKNGELRFDKTLASQGCVYDMMSIIFYARTLDYSNMKKGDSKTVNFIDREKQSGILIKHNGIENLKANDDKTYSCIVLSLIVQGDNSKFEDKNESMRVYVTNDGNRMPVRLDIKLKKGSSRAILRSYKGQLHTVSTK